MEDKYIFYKRKSSDSEDKQILSLDSQDRVIRENIAQFSSFNIIANFEESMSAKAPGRPKFNQMCEKLESGEAQNILCWQLNRLARNPVDGGRIIWLVQNYGVKIITPTKTYDANDVLLMYVEFAMSNQFITDLKKSTKRGLDDKLRAGIAPILAPVGYINDITKKQGLRDILPDSQRFELVRKMWDLLLSGMYSPIHILDIATNQWGLRNKNGKPISRTRIYDLFSNLFYTGQFEYNGQIYQGAHKPMITPDEFDRAQQILGKKGKPRMIGHQFAYTRLMKCVCGSGITAHERYRKVCPGCHHKYNSQKNEYCPKCKMEAPEKTWYICYYHCSKKYNPQCKQPYITEKDLESQIDQILESIYIPQEFIDWTLKHIRKAHNKESQGRKLIDENISTALSSVKRRLDSLFSKYISENNANGELITDQEYKEQKELLLLEKKRLEDELTGLGYKQEDWLDHLEKTFSFASSAKVKFDDGTKDEKRAILSSIGLNLVLDNRLLRYDLLKPFELIREGANELKKDAKRIEPKGRTDLTTQIYYHDIRNPFWGG